MADVFDNDKTDETTTLDTTIADTSILAKRLADKDTFIEQLKTENAQAREAVRSEEAKRKALEELLTKANPTGNQETRVTPTVSSPTDEDLEARISKLTKEERERERIQGNIDAVAAKLIETYGSEEKAREVVAAKAKELGVSPKFLQQVAAASPNAFFKQMDLSSTSKPLVAGATKGTVNTAALGSTNTGHEPAPDTYAYFQKMKAEKGQSWFLSPKVQNEMHKLAMEKGEAFYL
jgi:hypothetical protein